MARIVKLIMTHEARGKGVDGDPMRQCVKLYTMRGDLVADHDPWPVDAPKTTFDPVALFHVNSGAFEE